MANKSFSIKYAAAAATEFSKDFLQGMVDRMGVAFFRYGKVTDAYPKKVSALGKLSDPNADPDDLKLSDMGSLGARLRKYQQTGNRGFLQDCANFLMIEEMAPAHPDYNDETEIDEKSPGRVWKGEKNLSRRANLEF